MKNQIFGGQTVQYIIYNNLKENEQRMSGLQGINEAVFVFDLRFWLGNFTPGRQKVSSLGQNRTDFIERSFKSDQLPPTTSSTINSKINSMST